MSEWDLIEAPDGEIPGKVKLKKTYRMERGDVYVYNEKQLHSPRRDGPTKLIRLKDQISILLNARDLSQ